MHYAAGVTEPEISLRVATRADVPEIVRLPADDPLGARPERFTTPLPEGYYAAFEAIARDPNNEVVVAGGAGAVVAVLQITHLPRIDVSGRLAGAD